MKRRSVALVLTAAMALLGGACADDGGGVDAIRATASAQVTTTTTTTLPPETTTSTTAVPETPTTSTTVRPTTTTTRRPATTTTVRPTTTTRPPVTTPTTRFPGDTRRAVGWDTYVASGDGRAVTFSYYSGPPPCSIEDGIEVQETTTAVRVTIFERDGSGGQPCIAIAQQKSVTLTLAAPLGGRQVIDGARA